MKRNLIVGQSGGPTAAINSSLAGVYRGAVDQGYQKVYGMLHGVQGLMEGKWIDLADYLSDSLDMEVLRRTPASFLGSCRYKLPEVEEDKSVYEKIFERLDELEIDAFIYIGGNDSMDTIKKLADYGESIGHPCRFMGCPKTIDNDLAQTDHTPGYGSAAKYIATTVKEIIRDNICMEFPNGMVTIVEIMGRDAGWLTGASVLSRGEDCYGPDLIYLPEVNFDIEDFKARVADILSTRNSVCVCVSEGIHDADGKYICEYGNASDFVDAFGHKQLAGTASYLASYLSSELGCKARGVELSTPQRAASHIASRTDIREATMCGTAAVNAAAEGQSGMMVTMVRESEQPYLCGTEIHDIHGIANEVHSVPREWITDDGCYVKEEFEKYARPLILGMVQPIMVNGVPRHMPVPESLRDK